MASADELLTLFASMGTTDHDTLVTQFTQVAGADPDTARFFLEANNWSLQVRCGPRLSQCRVVVGAGRAGGVN
eukprot:m.145954 g.145954  ORF g.145954 m.145954 type:complete len:73 (-) comp10086_c2_seq6:1084-1302(-)